MDRQKRKNVEAQIGNREITRQTERLTRQTESLIRQSYSDLLSRSIMTDVTYEGDPILEVIAKTTPAYFIGLPLSVPLCCHINLLYQAEIGKKL